ncbi:hypothetical protein HPB51_009313 [Rhipicephalus microplus]|uniref:Uncharacterized protein n=1 Tax=Rhipicephalus microplus TaxID=6941 RepID=A0A9J6F0N4_RHIMP|nr:hypothetical protein HPB51_009313 [Rhipicephalus microplus]
MDMYSSSQDSVSYVQATSPQPSGFPPLTVSMDWSKSLSFFSLTKASNVVISSSVHMVREAREDVIVPSARRQRKSNVGVMGTGEAETATGGSGHEPSTQRDRLYMPFLSVASSVNLPPVSGSTGLAATTLRPDASAYTWGGRVQKTCLFRLNAPSSGQCKRA